MSEIYLCVQGEKGGKRKASTTKVDPHPEEKASASQGTAL